MSLHPICFFAGTHGDWGGSSRVLFTTLQLLDRTRFRPIVLLTRDGPASRILRDMGIEYEVWGPVTELHSPWRRFTTGRNIRPDLGISEQTVLVTFAGQVRRIKGVQDFIALASRLQGDHVWFLIVGGCREGAGLKDAFTERELRELISSDPRIQYVGYREDMPSIYGSSDIVVVPSRWEEPFGLVLIEAGAAKTPVVATRVGGIPEVVIDGETGLLVEAGNVEQLSAAVNSLVDQPELRVRMGEAAFRRVETSFTDKPVRKLEALYESLL